MCGSNCELQSEDKLLVLTDGGQFVYLTLSQVSGDDNWSQQGSPPSLSLQGFVLAVTIIREAVEEIRCYVRDKEVNSQVYSRLTSRGQPRGSARNLVVTRCRQVGGAEL